MSEDESGEDPSSDPTEHDPSGLELAHLFPARSAPRPAAAYDQGGPGESGRRCRERGPMIAIPSCSPTRSSDWWKPKGGRLRSMCIPCSRGGRCWLALPTLPTLIPRGTRTRS